MAKSTFKLSVKDELKLELFTSEGKLLTVIYDSGFRNLRSCHHVLLAKAINPPRHTKFRVTKLETSSNNTTWTNL